MVDTRRRPSLDSLYSINEDGSRNAIHPADVRGRYQNRKKLLWAVMITVYLLLPWLRVDGRPAVLIDIPRRCFYLFGQTLNAQDFYLAFFVLSGIGFTLFVVSALYGRVWCGYACPHTVFLDGVFRRVERWFEGSAAQQQQLDSSPWNASKLLRRGGKWVTYLLISSLLAHTLLGYFIPIREVVGLLAQSPADHPFAFGFVWILTAVIYGNLAWFREQLCIVVCPYGRLQGTLYDRDTINVTYDATRGEPRGKYTLSDRGDCIDCFRCVAVCPTGIDIRNGTQLECVGCANCIDACDEVMDKTERPRGLVRYASQNQIEGTNPRFWRPRLALYGVLTTLGLVVFLVAVARRTPFEARLLRQAGSPISKIGERLQNGLVLHLVNKLPASTEFRIEATAPRGCEVLLPVQKLELASLADRRIPLFVQFPRPDALSGGAPGQLQLRISTPTGETRNLTIDLLGASTP